MVYSGMNVYYLLFRRPDSTTYPVEIGAESLAQAISFVEGRDGSTFVQQIEFGWYASRGPWQRKGVGFLKCCDCYNYEKTKGGSVILRTQYPFFKTIGVEKIW